ncbi:MAG: hypothetical protein VX910_02270 [Candidatus Latescibacterota bacterium]|nr:hypothetical protein [Candidatus Latescibacterota bacterium]
MRIRPDLIPKEENDKLEVVQLTDEEIPSSHVYMEAQIFTPDSDRLLIHRSAHPHGSDPTDPEHQFLICNLEDNCSLTPIITELGTTGPSISPDGEYLYYFVDETEPLGGRLTLKRVKMDGTERETIYVLDHPISDTDARLSRPYPLSTISSDGKRIAISGFLGDGKTVGAPWGLLVFEIDDPSVRLIFSGPSWCNIHPQYTRQTDPGASHNIMIQENHGNTVTADGKLGKLVSGAGADIHLIRDDGSDFRNFAWGRDGNEHCQGHQCWVGQSGVAITSTGTREPAEAQLIAGRATDHSGHDGINTPNGWRNDLSRSFDGPDFYHFATDITGKRLITDAGPHDGGGAVWLFDLPDDDEGSLKNARRVADPSSSWQKESHIHPFLSPDGKSGFFNSDETGTLQTYMVRGWS